MCSLGGDIEEASECSETNTRDFKTKVFTKCKKCDEKPVLLLQRKDPFCKLCFLQYCNHKFRSTIGKSKKIKHGERVLLACSGGRKSTALLHMTQQVLKSASPKQINFIPGILIINDSIIPPYFGVNMKSELATITAELRSYDYPILYSSLEMVQKINTNQELYWTSENCFLSEISASHSNFKKWVDENMTEMTTTSKLDFIKHLKLYLITEIASSAGYKYVFVGDSSTSLAVELLSNVALGRGSQISSKLSFCDTRYKVPVCRPLREFVNKEIALYNNVQNNVYFIRPNLLTKTDVSSSVQRLTENFILHLQESFPGTVFNIFRTGNKLSVDNDSLEKEICFLCKSKLDNLNVEPCSALEALKISERLSAATCSVAAARPDAKESESLKTVPTNDDVTQFLCYGCSVTFKQLTKQSNFSSLLPTEAIKRMKRNEMKEQIQDFLLDGSDDDS